ncbi:MAG TPA: ATP-binding protein [Anaerolineae bacterium]|nr:ATP-binding protein [Anaerolineae bacterium]
MAPVQPLSADQLCRTCDGSQFDFETTAELEDLNEIIGQERAVGAVQFGIGIRREGYNLFALGPSGTGKRTTIGQFLDRKAAAEPVPSDWCYVNNFEQAHKPCALRLPSGQAIVLRKDMEQFIEELLTTIPAAFESEDYRTRRQEAQEEFKERQEKAFNELQNHARERSIALIRTPTGLAVAPLKEGEVISPDEFQKLPDEERKRFEEDIAEVQARLQETLPQARQWEHEARKKVKELDRQVATFAVGGMMDELRDKYAELPDVVNYLDTVQQDVVENVDEFRKPDEAPQAMGVPLPRSATSAPLLRRYQVNVLVDLSQSKGAPVVYESNPTYNNLIGRIEQLAQMGALLTDFNLIKPGALHRANGGYLILDARQLLLQPYAWEGLKRALRSREVRIESLSQALSLMSTVSLVPEPIPLDVKVVLIGDRMLYYSLVQLDPDFGELFKVEADFNEDMERTPESNLLYARLIATMARGEDLRPFDRGAVARVVEHSARMAGDANKLSVHLLSIADLLREADYWASVAGNGVVTTDDVQRAIDTQIHRADRVRERVHDRIQRGTVLIDTAGERVGQVNGLSVVGLGKFAFGQPSRITARVRTGGGKVVDIEREVKLGGPIHSKGVLILSSFLGARYAAEHPLSLSASLVFEQSYSGVEGDSASMAELCALLSALARVPIKQSFAMTGSVNQHGEAQPIGGVNEKTEGFFDVCKARGLTGEQGVVIPTFNVQHLMLRHDVVEAVEAGQFHIYPMRTVDEAIELLTGIPAGERDAEGNFPEGSINQLVEARLVELAEKQRAFSAPAKGAEEEQKAVEEEASENEQAG